MNQEIDDANALSWSAYHANNPSIQVKRPVSIGALLPLLKEPSHTPAMIAHVLLQVQLSVRALNPCQAVVITFDQPLYALAKQLQWQCPTIFGEDKFVVILGVFFT